MHPERNTFPEKVWTLTSEGSLTQVCFEVVGYLLEELRDGKNYEQFQKDISDANIFIGSLIFIEELAEKVSQHEHTGLRYFPAFQYPMLMQNGKAQALL